MEGEGKPLSAEALADMAAAIDAREGKPPAPPAISPAADVCPNCFYVQEFAPKRFQCRRYPPQPMFMGYLPPVIEGQSPQPIINALYPGMAVTSTCGEFKHKDPKKAA